MSAAPWWHGHHVILINSSYSLTQSGLVLLEQQLLRGLRLVQVALAGGWQSRSRGVIVITTSVLLAVVDYLISLVVVPGVLLMVEIVSGGCVVVEAV